MLRSLLKGIRHLQCGTHNALPAQILPISGYNQTKLYASDYGRFGRMGNKEDFYEEDDFEDESQSFRQTNKFQRNNYQRDDRFNRNQFQNRYNRNQFQGGYNRNQRQGGYENHRPGGYYDNQQRNNQRQNAQDLFDLEPVQWDEENLSECNRFEYTQNPDKKRSPEEVQKFREENQIKVTGSDLDPIMSFEEAPFTNSSMDSLKEKGWEKPTPIQAETWPIILSNKNMVGVCHTGSGKTLCYILPALEHIERQKSIKKYTFKPVTNTYSPFVLVLVPTRELAIQVHQVVNYFASEDVSAVSVFGGVKDMWYFSLRNRGVDICIATPGRLLALIKDNKLDLKNCTYMVIDEADTMLDMGFEQSVRCIMDQCRPDRQVLMWTATWSPDVQYLANSYLKEHTAIHVGSSDQTPNENITQNFTVCQDDTQKMENLLEIFSEIRENDKTGKIIIFANTRQRVQELQYKLRGLGRMPLILHGPMPQAKRQATIREFMHKPGAILVATDVASRGLDIDGVDYIINYDFPPVVKTYIHRIGRCGRKDIRGNSYTFLTYEDQKLAAELIELLEDSKQEINPTLLQFQGRRTRSRR